jgi:hypothetical protein
MSPNARRQTLACLLGVLILTAVMAAALPHLALKPGVPLPGQADVSGGLPPDQIVPAGAVSISTFWKAVLGILLVAAMVYNVYRLLKGVAWSWKAIGRSALYVLVLTVMLVGFLMILAQVHITGEPMPTEVPPPIEVIQGPALGAVPASLIWLVVLGLAVALAGLGLWLVLRPAARLGPDPLQFEAERALEALRTGADLKNVIVHCYWQMAQVLQQEQGLEREAAMTTREFQRLLEARGVPPAPVQQLTQLFEAARYGHRPPGPAAEGQAVDCLTAIVRYSQAGKAGQN